MFGAESEAPPKGDPFAPRKSRLQKEPRKDESPDVTSGWPFRPQCVMVPRGQPHRALGHPKLEGRRLPWKIRFPLLPLDTGPAWKAALLGPPRTAGRGFGSYSCQRHRRDAWPGSEGQVRWQGRCQSPHFTSWGPGWKPSKLTPWNELSRRAEPAKMQGLKASVRGRRQRRQGQQPGTSTLGRGGQ